MQLLDAFNNSLPLIFSEQSIGYNWQLNIIINMTVHCSIYGFGLKWCDCLCTVQKSPSTQWQLISRHLNMESMALAHFAFTSISQSQFQIDVDDGDGVGLKNSIYIKRWEIHWTNRENICGRWNENGQFSVLGNRCRSRWQEAEISFSRRQEGFCNVIARMFVFYLLGETASDSNRF